MPPKPDLVFHTASIAVETDHSAFTVQLSPSKSAQDLSHTNRPTTPIIEDWVSDSKDESETKAPQSVDHLIKDYDYHAKKMAQPTPRNYARRVLTQSKSVSITAVRPVSADVPKIMVTRPRLAHLIVTKSKSPIRWYITYSQSPKTSNSPPRVTAVQAPVGNPQYALKDKGVIDIRCSRHMIGNMSYLSNFEELNGGYVAFGSNPKGGKISGKGKIKTEDYPQQFLKMIIHVLLVRKASNIEPLENLTGRLMKDFWLDTLPTWLFDIDSLTRTMNYQPVIPGNQTNPSAGFQSKFGAEKAREEINQQYVLFLVWSSGSTNPHNYDGDAAFDGKEHDFDAKKPNSEVILSPSNSAQSRKQDDKTNKEANRKSHVESFIGYRDLSAEFEYCSDNSSNKVNVVGTIVPTVGQNSSNSTNPFSAAGPSNTTDSPTHGKSLFIDASHLFDDLDMPKLEDITCSNDENNVGAEADFNNLETSITVSPILTIRIHKDHPVSQIIGDLSLTTQTRSMTRVVKDQGGLSKMFNDDFYTCMFACFHSQEEPKRIHQALKDPSWIEAMHEELLQFKMQKVWVKDMTMDTTIDQQVAMDEALVPHAKRLRIGRSNFCLLSDIKSKESTL
nr:hypothetical protein [Tanacetum cinerariifolium]